MHEKGLKSVILAGNGESLLNKNVTDIINESKNIGIDVGLSTNGVLFNKQLSDKCMKSLTWIRFSTLAGVFQNKETNT